MNIKNIKIYCVTNKEVDFINDKTHILSWVMAKTFLKLCFL